MNPIDSLLSSATAVVFDIDGTLKHPRVIGNERYKDKPTHPGHMRNANDFVLYPGVEEELKGLSCRVPLFATSNQGGLTKRRRHMVNGQVTYAPIKTLGWIEHEVLYLMKLLPHREDHGSALKSVFFSPGQEAGGCYEVGKHIRPMQCWTKQALNSIGSGKITSDFYKPGCGMLEAITCIHSEAHGFDHLIYVGDREEDQQCVEAARAAGLNVDFVWAADWHKAIA